MYESWYNKQTPRNISESPRTDLGHSGSPLRNQELSTRQSVGIGYAAVRLYGAGKQVFNTWVNTSGDKLLKKRVKQVSTGIRLGTEVATIGVVGTGIVEGINALTTMYANDRQNTIDTINQDYEVQKRGVSVNKFVGVGERID